MIRARSEPRRGAPDAFVSSFAGIRSAAERQVTHEGRTRNVLSPIRIFA